ncbi:unnamed protein product [Rotaria sp. Silwood1]|nr:unnamed protein product [Rotaria sp. Silwood1]
MKPVRRSQSGSDEYDEENLDRHRHLIVQGYGSLPNRNLCGTIFNFGRVFNAYWQRTSESNDGHALDKYHTHFIVIDEGDWVYYLNDQCRANFVYALQNCDAPSSDKSNLYSVTIIVEGGFNTLEVILNDLIHKRPILIINGSGRIASLLGTLLEDAKDDKAIESKIIEDKLKNFPALLPAAMKGYNELLDRIKAVLDKRNRPYLNVFNLGCDEDLTEAVFRAALRSSQDKNKTDSNNKGQSDADPSDKQEILRDLLLWSVYTGRSDTAVVILLYIQERIGAALLAAALAIRISSSAKEINKRKVFSDHAKEYEKYATNCINACHKRNEERTSHILLSKKKIYGDATYMQVG